MIIRNVNHLNLIVSDFAKAKFFVETFLGLQPHRSYPTAYLFGEDDPLLVLLEFPKAKVADLAAHHHHRFRSITLVVDSLRDLGKKALYCNLPPFIQRDDGSDVFAHESSEEDLQAVRALCVRDFDSNLWRFVAR